LAVAIRPEICAMQFQRCVVGLSLLALFTTPPWVRSAQASPTDKSGGFVKRDAKGLAAKIDQLIGAQWAAKGLKPTLPAADAEFLRRVYLDVAGRIPYVTEVRDFLDDKSSDKRERLILRLLKGPNYVNHFTAVWRELLIPPSNNQQFNFFAPSFEAWLRERLKQNTGYDQMVREILTANATGANPYINIGGNFIGDRPNGSVVTPIAFYQANEYKAENLAANTSRLFLGVKLECAQCHDHPFNKYTRKQFWEYAAFFTGLQPQFRPNGAVPAAAVLKIPGTNKEAKPHFLDGNEPQAKQGVNNRQLLAEWMTRADNPFFARAAVNRLWAHFFGIGLVEPVDDLSEENPASHPELLDELARQFVAHRYDLKFMIQAITSSRSYQLSSVSSHKSQLEGRLFGRMAVKGMTPEQLFDSLVAATGYRGQPIRGGAPFFFGQNSPRAEFLAKFANQDKRTEFQTSILQALALMNGKFIADATSLKSSETLLAVIDSPFLDTTGKIEALFLAALNRKPREAERIRFLKYVTLGGPKGDAKAALADVFWVLLNSSEFMLNH
jgi:hypothetical protein